MKSLIFSKSKHYFNFHYFLIFFIIFNCLLSPSNCYVKIPFKYFPLLKYNETNPSMIYKGLISVKLYTILKLGNPQQSVHVPLDMDSNDFYITNSAEYSFNDYPDYFQDLMFFNDNISTTLDCLDPSGLSGDNFDLGLYYKDNFEFGDKKSEFEFYLSLSSLHSPESGGIGMQLNPRTSIPEATPNETRSFLKKLKDHKLTNDYWWTIFYNSKTNYVKNEEGFVLIGSLPDEIGEKLGYYSINAFKNVNFKKTNAVSYYNQSLNQFFYDEINAYDQNNNIVNISFSSKASLKVDLNFNVGGIKAPKNVLTFFEEKVFNEFITKNECFKEKSYYSSYIFFYCKNNKNTISEVKNKT